MEQFYRSVVKLMDFLPNQSEQAVVIRHSRSAHHKSCNPNTMLQLTWRPDKIKDMVQHITWIV